MYGHDTDAKGEFRGLFERGSGRIIIEAYDKLKPDLDERRFEPPSLKDVSNLVGRKREEVHWSSVDHNKGEFVCKQRLWGKLRSVSTQGIDGTWGRLKTFLRSRGGISPDHLETSVKEFQWRGNLPPSSDPFLYLFCCIRDGCLL